MQGLSAPAAAIIETFSTLTCLKDYQLVGGTALALRLNHRESEDLDFCQWVPDLNNRKYWVNAKSIHDELQQKFKLVSKNHLDGSQVNYYINDPGVKISFYHTTLKQPPDTPEPLIGNIKVSALSVLGGSKIFVTTRRTELRDYYDIYILVSQDYITIDQMLEKAAVISKDALPKKISTLYQRIKFSEKAKLRLI
jgi:predicted nucleotidyltransferase component of viral defense system